MRLQKTVLVLGAGASNGFGLPLGSDLKGLVAKDLNIMFDDFGSRLQSGSHDIVDALRAIARENIGASADINPHRRCAVSISRAMGLSGSIDEYVERHKDNPLVAECAKLAIAKAILDSERKSKLFSDHRNEPEDLIGDASGSWLACLLRDLTRGLTASQLPSAFENLFIIDFNYDRCVELLVFFWIQQVYDLSADQASKITKTLRIYHPYGKLGDLPFENPSSHIPFGATTDGRRLMLMASNIRTYSEAVEEGSDLADAREAMGTANKIVFLGFAFHEQNMELLKVPPEFGRSSLRCYATTQGISPPRLELDKQKIVESMRVESLSCLFFEAVGGSCEDFWTHFGDVAVQ